MRLSTGYIGLFTWTNERVFVHFFPRRGPFRFWQWGSYSMYENDYSFGLGPLLLVVWT